VYIKISEAILLTVSVLSRDPVASKQAVERIHPLYRSRSGGVEGSKNNVLYFVREIWSALV